MTVFEADWICPISSPSIHRGWLRVSNGKCTGFGQGLYDSGDASSSRVAFPGCAIIPGFINAHAHLELSILRGFLDDLPFSEWIPRLTRTKYEHLTRDEILLSARLGATEMLAAGVTCVGEVMDLGVSWGVMQEFGLQGIAYQEVFGPAESQAADSLTRLIRKIDSYRRDEAPTLRAGVSPHAPYTVSDKLFRAVNSYAQKEGLRLTTHIAESEEEGMFVRWGAGPFAERWSARGIALTPAGCSPVEYLDRLGLLRPETLLVHAIDLEDADFDILRNKRPAIVHCPKSNAKLAHGIARLAEIQETGIPTGLGTDSVASNNVIDMFEEMRSAIFQQRGRTRRFNIMNAETAFRMATLGGAECLGLSDHLGSLDAGKRADFVVVNLNDSGLQPVYDPIETMVYSACRKNVLATYLAGNKVNIDSKGVIEECAPIARRLSDLR